MEKLSFKVAEFDAPLDLILHLISKHKLSITDIDISSLLEQYMEHIRMWQASNMELASEFLEMASRLVHMKTVSLLPRHEEESEKLRRDLAGELMEYRLCKLAAQQLGAWDVSQELFVRKPVEIEIDHIYSRTHPAGILYAALGDALGKKVRRMPPPREAFAPIVTHPFVSVTSKIFTVLRALRREPWIAMDKLYSADMERSGMVATFLAVLELVKTKTIRVESGGISLTGRDEKKHGTA